MIQTHKGVFYETGRAYDTDFVLHIIDTRQVRMKIVTGFNTVPISTLANGAQLGFNNVGWGSHKRGRGVPNDLLWSEGRAIQNSPIDYRRFYSVNILKSGEVRFDTILRNAYNVIGFDRIIGRDGQFNEFVTDASKNPRTIYAMDRQGRLLILCCEGRAVDQAGLTFRECWDVLQKYDVIHAGNADGGYSTCAMNTAISNQTLIQSYNHLQPNRPTVSRTLFFAEPITGTPDTTPTPTPTPTSKATHTVKHDEDIPGGAGRTEGGPTYRPETCPLFEVMKNGTKITVDLSKGSGKWDDFLLAIQPSDEARQYIKVQKNGWVNIPQVWPKVQSVAIGGGDLIAEKMPKGWWKVKTFNLNDEPPIVPPITDTVAYQNFMAEYSWAIHRFISVNRFDESKRIDGRPGGVFIILVSPNGYMFVPEHRIQPK